MKKKLIIYMSKISIGGMEKALVDLLRLSNITKKYDVTLYLVYKNCKEYMELIPKNVDIHLVCKGKWNTLNKYISAIKMIIDLLLIKRNSYDISICYTHHHKILSLLARKTSKNNIVYIHTDLIKSRKEKALKKLLKKMHFYKFNKIVAVSNCAKNSIIKLYPNIKDKVTVINNYIDGKEIEKKSEEKINDYKFNGITFINIARHVEQHKKISRIILASKKLIDEGFNFSVILLGDGEDTEFYKNMIIENKLENCVKLLGRKNNPYPYLKHSDAFVFSSEYEGYGIVLDEARILNIPLITTDVADAKKMIDDGYGILCDNSVDGLYNGMKEFLEHGYSIKKKFDYNNFNDKITIDTNKILED